MQNQTRRASCLFPPLKAGGYLQNFFKNKKPQSVSQPNQPAWQVGSAPNERTPGPVFRFPVAHLHSPGWPRPSSSPHFPRVGCPPLSSFPPSPPALPFRYKNPSLNPTNPAAPSCHHHLAARDPISKPSGEVCS
jgi:hypothetical protein